MVSNQSRVLQAATAMAVLAAVTLTVWYCAFKEVSINYAPRRTAAGRYSLPALPSTLADQSSIRFDNLTVGDTGISFQYYGSPDEKHYMTEQNGGGVAVFDFDSDGVPDVFFSNGSHFERPADQFDASQTLYRQLHSLVFADVTQAAGLTAFGFGQGCATADFNNDGFVDLFVAGFGANRLWQNNGDGSFTEVTIEAGVGDTHWSTSAAFADLDADGDLDLYVTNYVDWSPDAPSTREFPSPMDFNGQADFLYTNDGDGSFIDVAVQLGVATEVSGKGLAVGVADFDADSFLDVYVANDTTRNFLFLNSRGAGFTEFGVAAGVAVSGDGTIGSSMGVAICDANGDSRPDVFVSNFLGEQVDAYTSMSGGGFEATSTELGIDVVAKQMLNFGIVTADFDLDLFPDLFFANGHLWDSPSEGWRYRMFPSLLRNLNGQRFADMGATAGTYFEHQWIGRAVASGDLDNDGATDLVVCHLEDSPAILQNKSVRIGRSVRVQVIGTKSCRQPLGCRVDAELLDSRNFTTWIPSGGSFQASHDPVVVIPSGSSNVLSSISVHWPGEAVEKWSKLSADETIRLIQGTGVTSVTVDRSNR